MFGAIASLGGALGAGGLIGLLKLGFEFWIESRKQKADHEHKKDLALGNQLVEYQKAIHGNSQEVDLEKDSKWTFSFLGKELFKYEGKKRKESIAHSLASWAHSVSLLMLVSTLCFCVWIWSDNPRELVYTLNPAEKPTDFGILWGLINFQIDRTNIIEASSGGLAFVLLHGILGIIGYVLVGTRFNRR